MAHPTVGLPKGTRMTAHISLGVLTKTFPLQQVKAGRAAQGKARRRQRDLPSHVRVYSVIALALFMQVSYREVLRCLLQGLAWLLGPRAVIKVAGKSGGARSRAHPCRPAGPNVAPTFRSAHEVGRCRAQARLYAESHPPQISSPRQPAPR
jgi:hypothetical protein